MLSSMCSQWFACGSSQLIQPQHLAGGSFLAGGLVKSQRDGKGTAEVEGSGIAGNGEAEGSFEVDAREGQRS